MRLIAVLLLLAVCLNANCVVAGRLNDIDYNEDTIAIEALADGVEDTATPSYEEVTTNVPSQRDSRSEDGITTQCVTNGGLSGFCTPVKECFPRLFPVDESGDDTPNQSGVYNQNLASLLIQASGFCLEGGNVSSRSDPVDFKNLVGNDEVCCATNKITGEFPLDNDTVKIDNEFLKKDCGKVKVDQKTFPDRIVGGREAALGEFPWMVAMLRRGQQFCGGSLLDERNVLTAAHCVEFMTKNDVAALRLNIGDLDIYTTKETKHEERRAKRVLYHKGFSMKSLDHDIALIHLDKPVKFSNTIQPVCLHPGNPPYDTGKEDADVTGWGTTSSGGSQSSKLLAVVLDVITQDECNKKYEGKKKVGPGMVCAARKGKDSCQGDSGGPLVMDSRNQAKQIGIVSWGIGCATYPGVYTRVDKYMKWINKNKL